MRRTTAWAILAGAIFALAPPGGSPAEAQAGRVICVFNDAGAVLRARAIHADGTTGWDRMASAQRACWYNLNGRVEVNIQFLDVVTWDPVCTRIVEPGQSRTIRVTGTVWTFSCQ